MNLKRKPVKPFVVGMLAAVGVVAGVVAARVIFGPEGAAPRTAGGAAGGVVAVIVCLCAVAASRRRRGK